MLGETPYIRYSEHMELDERLIHKVTSYKVAPEALDPIRETPLLFLVGITAAGKDTVQRNLLAEHPDDYHIIVSHTTRAPRANDGIMEQDGVHYHFVDFATVDGMLDNHEFVEAKVIHFKNVYGTSIAEIAQAKDDGKIAITDVDIQGVAEYMHLGLNAKAIFLLPPSYEIWKQRFMARYGGSAESHDYYNRMRSALAEMEHALQTDYYYIVINDDIHRTVDLVNRIAHGEAIEPHFQKAVDIAESLRVSLIADIAAIEAKLR